MAKRLLVTYLAITALTLAIVVVPLGRVFADREQSRLTFDIERDAQAVASLVEDALEAGIRPSVDSVPEAGTWSTIAVALSSYRDTGGRIVVVNTDGISVADSDHPTGEPRDFSTRPEIIAGLEGRRTSDTRASTTAGTDLLYVAVPVASGGVVHGVVRITYPTSTVDARIRSTWLRLGAVSAVVLGLVAVVGVSFANGVTRPIRRLQQAAVGLAEGDFEVRVDETEGPPELRHLANTFNRTAAQLTQLIDAQRRFVADASHQLRTPLTALRLRIEMLEPHVDADVRPKLDAALAETDRLGRLVQSLLVLARSDATTTGPVPTDAVAAMVRRIEVWTPVVTERSVRLRGESPDEVWILAVPGALDQILDNLISNALDAVEPGTEILVRLDEPGDTIDLHVIDQGPGLDDDARSHAFERFWQPPGDPNSRSGFGLGLAIVSQLADVSGGSARLLPGPDNIGLDVVVTFRRGASPPATRTTGLQLTETLT